MRRKNKKKGRTFGRKRSEGAVSTEPDTEEPPHKKARFTRQTNDGDDAKDDAGLEKTELKTVSSQSHRIPLEGTYPRLVWERLQQSSLLQQSVSPSASPLLVLQTMMRVRLVSGNDKSAMQLCHVRLQQAYQRLPQEKESIIDDHRDTLIALWCLYLQMWVELGFPESHVWVTRIRTCPIVGNHPTLTLWRARFLYQQQKTEEATHELEQGRLLAQQQQVPTETTATCDNTILPWVQHDTGIPPLQPDPISLAEVEESLRAVWDLPSLHKPHALQYYWYPCSTDILKQPEWLVTDRKEALKKGERNCERCSRVFALQEEEVWCPTCRNPFHVRAK